MSNSPTVFIVDDSESELFLMEQAIRLADTAYEFAKAVSGEDLMQQLEMLPEGDAAALPSLLLSDVNLPGIDGFQILEKIKANPAWQHIPVVLMSSVHAPGNEAKATALGAIGVVTKPGSLPDYIALAKSLPDYFAS